MPLDLGLTAPITPGPNPSPIERTQVPGMPPTQQAPPNVEQNKSLWRSFLDRMDSDPSLRQSLLMMGAGMLRSPSFGQNGWDVLSNSVAQGMQTYQSGRANAAQQALAERGVVVQERRAGTEEKATAANIDQGNRGAAVAEQNAATNRMEAESRVTTNAAQVELGKMKQELDRELGTKKLQIEQQQADADTTRAGAYRSFYAGGGKGAGGGNPGQNVLLVQMRAKALMAQDPTLTEDQAILQAQQFVLDDSKHSSTPAEIAERMFKSSYTMWAGNLDNMGKTPPTELQKQWLEDAKNYAKQFSQLGKPPVASSTRGSIDRSGFGGKIYTDAAGKQATVLSVDDKGMATLQLPSGSTTVVPFDQIKDGVK